MGKIQFTKMHGAGNDYIYVNTMLYDVPNPAAAAIAWSDRHKGIGSDGLVLIGRSPVSEADFTMRIFNADGSEAMMCGNASRCIGKYLYERGITDKQQIRLLTLSGIKVINLNLNGASVESVTVDMLSPELDDKNLYIPNRRLPRGTFVSMGNPHYVIFTDDVDQVDKTGPILENHPAFPQRCNIEFVTPLSSPEDDTIVPAGKSIEVPSGAFRVRVWERGSGVTQACGTGACATAVAAVLTGRAPRHSQIVMDGGTLNIEWRESDNHVYMTGPAAYVFDGEIELK